MAGAVLLAARASALRAQQPTRPPQAPPADTVRLPIPPGARSDSIRIDSVRGIPDTLKTPTRRDSIQAPIARAELPPEVGVGPLYRWTRDSVLATGAVTLGDLLERVPGLSVFRTGFLASAQTAAYLGDVARVRVFRDGIELDALTTRAGGVQDVGDYALSNADDIAIERAAGEIRVYIRSWTVRNTTAYTRVDAYTGDEDTNLYRFFYGKRFGSGFTGQVGVQQFGTGARNRRLGGGGNVLDAIVRLGWARRKWSVDAVYDRLDRERNLTTSFAEQDSLLPRSEIRRSEAYVRAAYGNPDSSGAWGQVIASTTTQTQNGTGVAALDSTIVYRRGTAPTSVPRLTVRGTDSVFVADSASTRIQYVLAGGYTFGRLRVSGTDRLRAMSGSTRNTPSARLSYDTPLLSVSAFSEWNGAGGAYLDTARVVRRTTYPLITLDTVRSGSTVTRIDSTVGEIVVRSRDTTSAYVLATPARLARIDLSARISPLPWLAVLGSVSRDRRSAFQVITSDADTNRTTVVESRDVGGDAVMTTRVEGAVRYGNLWISGGVVRRGAASLAAPAVYECVRGGAGACAADDSTGHRPIAYADPAATGGVFAARGRFYKDLYLDAHGTVWQSGGAYRPQYQLRTEIGVRTNWVSRFPTGNFGLKFAVIDEYRGRTYFPTFADAVDPVFVAPWNAMTVQLEIRILSGTLSYQLRNALNRRFEVVPGFVMPGPINYYGLRWTFWN